MHLPRERSACNTGVPGGILERVPAPPGKPHSAPKLERSEVLLGQSSQSFLVLA